MGAIYGTTEEFLPPTDDGFEGPIEIPPGFPFGSSVQTQVFVSFPVSQVLESVDNIMMCFVGWN